MRALLLARKSNKVTLSAGKRGDGLSLETQDEVSRAFADAQGWDVVGAAGDTVSGRKVKPTDRKNLGPWLTDPALTAQWDVLVAAAGDRISRERIEFWSELEAWAVGHGKTLVVVERGGVFFPPRHEGDSYNWTGIKSGAGQEWDVIRGRNVRSQCRIMRDGFMVGRAPFGYRIEGEKYRKHLVADDVTAKYVKEIFERAIAGYSQRAIATWLTGSGVLTERGRSGWDEGVIRNILVNETYTGKRARHCAECGETHLIEVPALVDMATQARARAALKSRQRGIVKGGGRPSKTTPAMLIPTCSECGVSMYRAGRDAGSYHCRKRTKDGERTGCGLTVSLAMTDAAVNAAMAKDTRDETIRKVTYPAAELESAAEALRRAERAAFESEDDEAMLTARRDRRAAEELLRDTPRESVVDVPTGRTRAQAWAGLDAMGKRAWIKSQGIEIRISRHETRVSMAWWSVESGKPAEPGTLVSREGMERHVRGAR